MTDEQWEKIRPFVEAQEEARWVYEMWGMTNSNQPTLRERTEVAVGFQLAGRALSQATDDLSKALKEAGL